MQSTKVKCSLKFDEGNGDELFVMMQQARTGDGFVRDVKAAPEPVVVMTYDRQLDYLLHIKWV